MGKGYIIGAGPGDIGLITQKGYKLIEKADVLIAVSDAVANGEKSVRITYNGKVFIVNL